MYIGTLHSIHSTLRILFVLWVTGGASSKYPLTSHALECISIVQDVERTNGAFPWKVNKSGDALDRAKYKKTRPMDLFVCLIVRVHFHCIWQHTFSVSVLLKNVRQQLASVCSGYFRGDSHGCKCIWINDMNNCEINYGQTALTRSKIRGWRFGIECAEMPKLHPFKSWKFLFCLLRTFELCHQTDNTHTCGIGNEKRFIAIVIVQWCKFYRKLNISHLFVWWFFGCVYSVNENTFAVKCDYDIKVHSNVENVWKF